MSGNPRNKEVAAAPATENKDSFDPSAWKFMTVGSLALKNGRELVRENDISFTINTRNAEMIRDLAQHILDKGDENERISLSASPFYENSVSENVLKFFSHRLYISAETIQKIGKTFADYVKPRADESK